MAKVTKRNGNVVIYDKSKIMYAIKAAMAETKEGVDELLAENIVAEITEKINEMCDNIEVEQIQDIVENALMDSSRKDAAKRYILYRYERDKTRDARKRHDGKLLSEEFISQYKHRPSPMKELGDFVYYRTYSRYLPNEKRREYWWETVRRAVEYNTSLVPTTKEEAEKLYDNIYNLRQFLSGRTFWVGNTDVAKNYPMANYNCAFEVINSFESFRDLFYLLMVGAGVGVRVLKDDVEKLPKIRTNYNLIHEDYTPIGMDDREDSTSLEFKYNQTVRITVGDSKEGWVQSLDYFFRILYSNEFRKIKTIIINYDNVRPKGERLKTFGGTASGHESLKNMFYKIDRVIKKAERKRIESYTAFWI